MLAPHVVFVLLSLVCMCQAQYVEMYFTATSTRLPPTSSPTFLSCPVLLPCSLGDPSNPFHADYGALPIRLNLVSGGTFVVAHETNFTAAGGAVTLRTTGAQVLLKSLATLSLGTEDSRPLTSALIYADLRLLGSEPLALFARDGIFVSNCSIDAVQSTSSLFASVHLLNHASFLVVGVNYTGNSNNSDVFSIFTPNSSNLDHLWLFQLYATGFRTALNLEGSSSINDFSMEGTTLEGDGSGVFVRSPDTPVLVLYSLINDSSLSGCNVSEYSCLQVSVGFDMLIAHTALIASSFQISAAFEGAYFGLWHAYIDGSSLDASGYNLTAIFTTAIVDSVVDFGNTIQIIDGLTLIRTAFSSLTEEFFMLFFNSRDSMIYVSSLRTAHFYYGNFLRTAAFTGHGYLLASAYDVFLYDVDLAQVNPSTKPMLRIASPSDTLIFGGKFATDGLHFNPSSSNPLAVSLYGEISIFQSLTSEGAGTTVRDAAIIIFNASPFDESPVLVSNITISSPVTAIPQPKIVLVAASSSIGSGAVMFDENSPFDPSQHHLEVYLRKSDLNGPIDGSALIPLVFGLGFTSISSWLSVTPSITSVDASRNFGGLLVSNSSGFFFNVTSYACPQNCSGSPCVGVNFCNCGGGFSGYSCSCSNLPFAASCSKLTESQWEIPGSLVVGGTATAAELPISASISGSISNNGGSLYFGDGIYDVAGQIANQGKIYMETKVEKYKERDGTCQARTTGRTSARTLSLSGTSEIIVNVDISGADASPCPILPSASKRDFSFSSSSALRRSIASSNEHIYAESASVAEKNKATLIVDTSTLNGNLTINVTGTSAASLSMRILSTRNVTGSKSLSEASPLAVQVIASPGTCASVQSTAAYVDLFTSPCPVAPEPSKPNASNKDKWIRYGIPLIVIGVLAIAIIIIVILVLTVPSVRYFFRPYAKRAEA